MEFAGHASLSSSSYDPSDPLTPLKLDAEVDWNADSGATSHMTPHRHWFHQYKPFRTPICLADKKVVYSAGIGTIIFEPVINGVQMPAIEFTRVLHVPDLRTNLFSILYLTRVKSFIVLIDSSTIHFQLNGQTLFTACINPNNAVYLQGTTRCISEYANLYKI